MHYRHIVFTVCIGSMATLTYSQTKNSLGTCSIKARSEAVVIMICPPDTSKDSWRMAGQAACGATKGCMVYGWYDSAKAPDTAPGNAVQLPKRDVAAIWLNDQKSLVKMKRSGVLK